MASRSDTEAEIASDGRALATIVDLLSDGVSLRAWPEESLRILGLATADVDGAEQRKVMALRRHLTGGRPMPVMIIEASQAGPSVLCRRVERVRADLIGLVPYRCLAKMSS
jgi:hypothetical protein